jgi:hypothetical protein
MDLLQYPSSRLRRWIGLLIWGLVFLRVAFLFGAKLYFGTSFQPTDLILAVLGVGGGAIAYLYLKALLRQNQGRQDG